MLTTSLRKPWKIPFIPLLACGILFTSRKVNGKGHEVELVQDNNNRRCVVLFSSNERSGLRSSMSVAIAKRIREMDPDIELILFLTHDLEVNIHGENISVYRIPHKNDFSDMTSRVWNDIIEKSLKSCMAIHKPSIFLFDGRFPFKGVIRAMEGRDGMYRIWLVNSSMKNSLNKKMDSQLSKFNILIQQKLHEDDRIMDLKCDADIIQCDPIFNSNSSNYPIKSKMQSALGLNKDNINIYVNIKKGKIDDESSLINSCLKVLDSLDGIYVYINRKSLKGLDYCDGKREILNSTLEEGEMRAFDFVISTAEKHNLKELVRFSIPTLCFPTDDDEFDRTKILARHGLMIVLDKPHERQIHASIERLLSDSVRSGMTRSGTAIVRPNGAHQVARWIVDNSPTEINETE